MLHTWRFTFNTTLVPLLIYNIMTPSCQRQRMLPRALCSNSNLKEMFVYTTRNIIGDVYVVSDDNTSGRIHFQYAQYVSSSPIPELPFVSSHYSAPYTLYKLDMLRHIPFYLDKVVLVDYDVILSPDFVIKIQQIMNNQKRVATMSVSSAGGKFHGLQAGVIAFQLSLLRKIGPTWWNISGLPHNLPLGEQTLWDHFSKVRPNWIGHLPCGFHLETQVLQAALIDFNLSLKTRYPKAIRCPNEAEIPQIIHGAGGMRNKMAPLARVLPSFQCMKFRCLLK